MGWARWVWGATWRGDSRTPKLPQMTPNPSRAGPFRAEPGWTVSEPSRADDQCVRYSNLPGGSTQKRAKTLYKHCTFQRASRLRETDVFKIKCRLVYARRYILGKSCVSCTPNTYFGWWTTPSRMGMDEATMANTFQKVVSRARQMHTFKKLHSPASISSTPDAHFQNQVLSRLRETLFVLRS